MIITKEKTIVLKCGACGTDFSTSINIFSIGTNRPFEAYCPCCSENVLKMVSTLDKHVVLDINCFVCCDFHQYKFKSSVFWQDELFALPCGAVNMDISMIGEKNEAETAMESLNNSLEEIREKFETEIAYNNNACMLSALNHMYDLAKDGKIICVCNNGDIKIEAKNSGIEVGCGSCGAVEHISVENDEELKAFLQRKSIVLVNGSIKHGGKRVSRRSIAKS